MGLTDHSTVVRAVPPGSPERTGQMAVAPAAAGAGRMRAWRVCVSSWRRTTCSCGRGCAPSSPMNRMLPWSRSAPSSMSCWPWSICTSPIWCLPTSGCRRPKLMRGIRAARALRTSHPTVGVVVLSQFVEASYALALLDEGSTGRGYLLKDRGSPIPTGCGRRAALSSPAVPTSMTPWSMRSSRPDKPKKARPPLTGYHCERQRYWPRSPVADRTRRSRLSSGSLPEPWRSM